ncbi:DUF2782 domain-containing protein [Thiohalocapsa marina]|uniref:DUF2782 domain-containing protein n=2 Tax=Thiohalocapsa marina TaxID=424902 RepID=A0A5M8FD33_9GAMM|nr:DUF2782 domain-containing protein [Thiohalocapsa marina]
MLPAMLLALSQMLIGPSQAAAAATGGVVPLSSLSLRVTDADIQPAVTVKQFDNRTVEEYRVNNNVYMLKVTPDAGPSYYLVDEDGSGEMAWRRGTQGMDDTVPQWTLMSW